jgi:ABC-type branched-subunit amino acid transport system substrate-binding protein
MPEPVEYLGTPEHAKRIADEFRQRQVQAVIFLGSDDELLEFYRTATEAAWTPWMLLPGALAGPSVLQAPPAFRQRLLIAYPTLPRDRAPDKLAELVALADAHQTGHLEVVTYAMASVFDERVRRAGRRLGRDSSLAALRNPNGHDAGLLPPISFGENRRVGVAGAYIVSLDPASPAQATWVKIDD